MILGLQFLAVVFALIMVYFAYVNFKRREINRIEVAVWVVAWSGSIIMGLFPDTLRNIAETFFISRLLDLLIMGGFVLVVVMVSLAYVRTRRLEKKLEDLVRKEARKNPEIISWESKKDKGQVDAINKGLSKATGDIVTYINADDVYKKGALLEVGRYFAKHPKTFWVAGKGEIIDLKGKVISSLVTNYKNFLLSQNRYELLLMVNYLMQPSVFISKKAFHKYGPLIGTEIGVMEYDLWLKIGEDEMPEIMDSTLSSFRIYQGSISTKNFKKMLLSDEKTAEKYTQNPLILLLHYLHNVGRAVAAEFFNKNV